MNRLHRHLTMAVAASCGLVACLADRDLPPEYRRLDVPRVRLATPEVQRQGRAVYRERCRSCHGEQANGRGERAALLVPAPRDFTDAAWQGRTDERRLYAVIAEGRPGTAMAGLKNALTVNEIWSVVAFIKAIGPEGPPPLPDTNPARQDTAVPRGRDL